MKTGLDIFFLKFYIVRAHACVCLRTNAILYSQDVLQCRGIISYTSIGTRK